MLQWISERLVWPGVLQVWEHSENTRGLLSGTHVATSLGWRLVETLREGDRLVTFDNGLMPLREVSMHPLWNGPSRCPRRRWPLHLAQGALGNRGVLHVMPQQEIMLECDEAEALFGDPYTVVSAEAFANLAGTERVAPTPDTLVVTLQFDEDQVIFAKEGVMFLCPSMRGSGDDSSSDDDLRRYQPIRAEDARRLTQAMSGKFTPFRPKSYMI